LIVSDTYASMRGGVPAETRQLLAGLAARGHDVALCSDAPLEGTGGSAHYRLTLPTSAALAGEVGTAISAFRPDIVHVMAMSSRGLVQLRATLAPLPWLLTCHSLPPYERKLPLLHGSDAGHYALRAVRFLPHALAWRWLFRRRRVPQVVVHSPWMATLAAGYGQRLAAIETILLGVDPEPASLVDSRPEVGSAPRVLTIAGIAHTKGYHDALTAIGVLRQRFPGATYQVVGEIRDESYLAFLTRSMQRLGLSEAVRITPNLPHAAVQRALAECDLYLQPSHEEGFCLAYIEAAQRVPRLVGTATGAIPLISESDPGARVVPVRRPARLASAMADLLSRSLPADLMQRRAERLRGTLDWDRYLDAHESLYARVRTAGPARSDG
jgi:glycosyltransferase involved in cell wall biosynthesis